MPQANTSWKSFLLGGERFVMGSHVLVRPDGSGPDYIAVVEHIRTDAKEEILLDVRWYYRPEETAPGRQPYQGDDEVLESDHSDTIHVSSVNSRCHVLTLDEYQERQNSPKRQEPDFPTFFCRSKYFHQKKTVEPKKLPTVCTCEQPENPDIQMVCCDSCDKWFHTSCVGLTSSKLKTLKEYLCARCDPSAASHAKEEVKTEAADDKASRKRKR